MSAAQFVGSREATIRYLADKDIRTASRAQVLAAADMSIPKLAKAMGIDLLEARILRTMARKWIADGWTWEDAEGENPYGYWKEYKVS